MSIALSIHDVVTVQRVRSYKTTNQGRSYYVTTVEFKTKGEVGISQVTFFSDDELTELEPSFS